MDEVINGLFVGNGQAPFQYGQGDDIDVVTVCRSENQYSDHHFPLYDGEVPDGIEEELRQMNNFNDAVKMVLYLLSEERNVLLHCAAGISRAPTVGSTVIALKRDIGFGEALSLLQEERPQANPAVALERRGVEYVAGQRNSY